jgi:hypothetical protein
MLGGSPLAGKRLDSLSIGMERRRDDEAAGRLISGQLTTLVEKNMSSKKNKVAPLFSSVRPSIRTFVAIF